VPAPLLLVAGTVALLPLASIVRRPTALPRLVAEAFGTARAVNALVWFGGTRRVIALWLLERRVSG
jgi:hypothetical protein